MAGELVNPDGTPWTEAFPSQRPPFQPGNQLSLKHGATSPQRVDPIAHGYIAELLADPQTEYLNQPRFAAALWAWAVAQAKMQLVAAWVDDMPIEQQTYSGKGQTSPLELLRKMMSTTQTAAARLGLDPLSAARLGKDITSIKVDLATLLSRMGDGTPTPP